MNKNEELKEIERLGEELEIKGLPEMEGMDVLIESLRKLNLEDIKKLRSALWLVGGEDINSPDYEPDRPNFDNKYFFHKVDGEHKKVDIDTIVYLEAKDNYVYLHYPSGKSILIRTTLEGISRELPIHEFYRINRTHVVAFKYITAFTKEYVKLGELEFPVSKKYHPLLEWRVEVLGTY